MLVFVFVVPAAAQREAQRFCREGVFAGEAIKHPPANRSENNCLAFWWLRKQHLSASQRAFISASSFINTGCSAALSDCAVKLAADTLNLARPALPPGVDLPNRDVRGKARVRCFHFPNVAPKGADDHGTTLLDHRGPLGAHSAPGYLHG